MRKKTVRTHQQTLATAYHEAGHVVIGHRFGVPVGVKGVSVVSDNETHGRVDLDKSARKRLSLDQHIMVLFSGLEAQRAFSPRSIRNYHASMDYKDAVTLLFDLENNETFSVLDAHIKFLLLKTRQTVRLVPVWLTIVAVAEALHKRQHMHRDEIEQVIRSTANRRS